MASTTSAVPTRTRASHTVGYRRRTGLLGGGHFCGSAIHPSLDGADPQTERNQSLPKDSAIWSNKASSARVTLARSVRRAFASFLRSRCFAFVRRRSESTFENV